MRIAAARDRAVDGLADRLRAHTAALHRRAERSGFVAEMLRGRASRRGYALFLRNLLPAYVALEEGLARRRAEPALVELAEPRLERASAIRRDLTELCGGEPTWPSVLPVGRAYGERVAAADPDRLVAHAYVRYLGDLNGGRILRTLLARAPGLAPRELGFHEFPGIVDLTGFEAEYRRSIDRACEEVHDVAVVLDEAAAAFAYNIAVSEAVQAAS